MYQYLDMEFESYFQYEQFSNLHKFIFNQKLFLDEIQPQRVMPLMDNVNIKSIQEFILPLYPMSDIPLEIFFMKTIFHLSRIDHFGEFGVDYKLHTSSNNYSFRLNGVMFFNFSERFYAIFKNIFYYDEKTNIAQYKLENGAHCSFFIGFDHQRNKNKKMQFIGDYPVVLILDNKENWSSNPYFMKFMFTQYTPSTRTFVPILTLLI